MRGHALGYPTANIPLPQGVGSGIYAARAWLDGREYAAAVFADDSRQILETHLLDFSDGAYGKELRLELVKKLRESKAFADDDALKAAIAADVAAVRALLI